MDYLAFKLIWWLLLAFAIGLDCGVAVLRPRGKRSSVKAGLT